MKTVTDKVKASKDLAKTFANNPCSEEHAVRLSTSSTVNIKISRCKMDKRLSSEGNTSMRNKFMGMLH